MDPAANTHIETSSPTAGKRSGWVVWLLLLGIVILAVALRIPGLADRSLWLDEILTYKDSSRSIAHIFSRDRTSMHPPLLYVLTKGLLSIGGTEGYIRFQAFLCGVLSIPAVFMAGAFFFNRRVGLIAALLLAISPFHVEYSQQARHYAMMTLFAIGSAACFMRCIDEIDSKQRFPRISATVGFVVFTAGAIWSHYGSLLLIGAEGLFLGCWFFRSIVERSIATARRIFQWSLVAYGGFFILFLPLSSSLFRFAKAAGINEPSAESASNKKVVLALYEAQPDFPLTFFGECVSGAFYPFLIALLAGILYIAIRGDLRSRRGMAFLAFWGILPLLIMMMASSSHRASPRYLLFSLPALLLAAAVGVESLGRVTAHLLQVSKPRTHATIITVSTVFVVAFAASEIKPLKAYFGTYKYPWRETMDYVAERAEPGDGVVIFPEFLKVVYKYYRPPGDKVVILAGPEMIRLAEKDPAVKSIWVLGGHLNRDGRRRGHADLLAYLQQEFPHVDRHQAGQITLTRVSR